MKNKRTPDNRCQCGREKARRYAACGSCWSKLKPSDRDALANTGSLRRYNYLPYNPQVEKAA